MDGMTAEKGMIGRERNLFRERDEFVKGGSGAIEEDGPSTLL
jgi:hypothetical protein